MLDSKIRLENFDSGKGYSKGANYLTIVGWYVIKWLFFLTSVPYPSGLKVFLLKLFGAKAGKGIIIKPKVNIHMPWRIEIGDYAWIGEEVFILNFEQVTIGNNVCISQRAFLCGGNHDYLDPGFMYRNGPIVVRDGAWVGASCFIGPNVVIGIDAVVSAGSVVTKSVSANGIYKGNPAEFVKKRWD
ncbi:WcaF family extracellular polysaccharide biosynthesis acetyltransferase [Mucilaginibacter gotjawali]|uniref:Colanic acid biosynthesis acetyltransferase WcaF n=2 Tax=Mucilaginibacter gotjawali TaxID=1550579 RepID=A0A839SGT9_9SPHI|nr:WcaF family extracellular polysaccharide biosynthesis acetyltransferase [Mucilaginibacter gotjawali]MBB3057511.1 putative colanic acid biosynthesis acetyltransferase WcaF [Mucilaginibacter gotjawali]BAU55368.1 Galactoside O-acetyltransferase [Mucilaginibacter gotjawali]